jgi:hypothetical protein
VEVDFPLLKDAYDIEILPKFHSAEFVNGFLIQIYCMSPYYIGQSYELFKAAFTEFASLDYAIMSIPNTSSMITFLSKFFKVPNKKDCYPPYL